MFFTHNSYYKSDLNKKYSIAFIGAIKMDINPSKQTSL